MTERFTANKFEYSNCVTELETTFGTLSLWVQSCRVSGHRWMYIRSGWQTTSPLCSVLTSQSLSLFFSSLRHLLVMSFLHLLVSFTHSCFSVFPLSSSFSWDEWKFANLFFQRAKTNFSPCNGSQVIVFIIIIYILNFLYDYHWCWYWCCLWCTDAHAWTDAQIIIYLNYLTINKTFTRVIAKRHCLFKMFKQFHLHKAKNFKVLF